KVKIYKSSRKDKQRHVVSVDNKKPKIDLHYGDPNMKEYPGTKRGDNYCTRSLGIAKKYDNRRDLTSPNFWSRWDLWNCKGEKSMKKKPNPREV
ncbi:MAG: hypothetical protein ACOC56_05780, partial [Atribacterota bacterium]